MNSKLIIQGGTVYPVSYSPFKDVKELVFAIGTKIFRYRYFNTEEYQTFETTKRFIKEKLMYEAEKEIECLITLTFDQPPKKEKLSIKLEKRDL